MPELAQRLRLDLPDAFARHREAYTYLFEGEVAPLVDPEAQPQHLLLTGRERAQNALGLAMQVAGRHPLDGRRQALVLDEIAELIVLLVPDRTLEREGLPGDAHDAPHLLRRQLHADGDLFGGRITPELLDQHAGDPGELVHGLDHVDGDADGTRL